MDMVKLSEFRRRGMIVAKRHDAFLLALLLAVLVNAAVVAVQALLPRLALLVTLFGINPPPPLPDAEKQIPFVLVDPSLFDEEVRTDLPADAEGTVGREARQTVETPDLPEGTAYREEGIDIILTAPEGNPGPADPRGDADGDQDQSAPPGRQESPEPAESPPEPHPAPEPAPEPEPEPEPEPAPEPEPDVPEIAPAPPDAERLEASPEEALSQPEFTRDEAEPAPPRPIDPLDAVIDLATLAVTPEGFIDPSTRELERVMNQSAEQPRPPLRERPRTERPEPPRTEPPARPDAPAEWREAPRPRPGRPQPVFKKIGAGSSGGAPPRRSTQTSVRLIGEDASMRILQHRWPAYMAKVARQLQESLNRQIGLSPTIFSAGQVKISFGIAPDGALSHFETIYVQDGLEAERIMSERMLQEAAPFDPLTPEMRKDVNFQQMTVVVTLM